MHEFECSQQFNWFLTDDKKIVEDCEFELDIWLKF